jgi:NADH-quinone oxidoreductase subunit H
VSAPKVPWTEQPPEFHAALRARAVRLAVLGSTAACGAAVMGGLVALLLLRRYPVAVLPLVVVPLLVCLALLAAAGLIRWAEVFGRLLARFSGLTMLGATVGFIVLAWLHAGLFRFVSSIPAAPERGTWFHGVLDARAIDNALPGLVRCMPVAYALWPLQFSVVRDILIVIGFLIVISLVAMYCIWWERKVSGHIQSRLGPMRTGLWHGWAQSPADGLKLIGKEDLIPDGADQVLFRLAPYLALAPVFTAFMALPFGAGWVFRDFDVGLIFILSMLGIDVVSIILAGWASNNKWSVFGAMREACQVVSYEIPMGMSLLIPVMTVGTMRLTAIGEAQSGGWFTWLWFANPFCFLAMFVYVTASLASLKRAPFDLPEGESELVAGFMTEYSGFRWCVFFFAEYASMFVVAGLQVVLFLGAWYSPLPAAWGQKLGTGLVAEAVRGLLFSGPLWFTAKVVFMIYVQMWLRWTLPRIRIDQVMYACVQVLLPLTMVLLLGNAFWELFNNPERFPLFAAVARGVGIALALAGAFLAAGFVVISLQGVFNRRQLVGPLAVDHLPGA